MAASGAKRDGACAGGQGGGWKGAMGAGPAGQTGTGSGTAASGEKREGAVPAGKRSHPLSPALPPGSRCAAVPNPTPSLWISTRRRPHPTPSHAVHRRSPHTRTARPSHPPPVLSAAAPSPSLSPNPGSDLNSQIPLTLLIVLLDLLLPPALLSNFLRAGVHHASAHSVLAQARGFHFRSSLVDLPPVSAARSLLILCAYTACGGGAAYLWVAAACSVGSLFYVLAKAVGRSAVRMNPSRRSSGWGSEIRRWPASPGRFRPWSPSYVSRRHRSGVGAKCWACRRD
ncbi:uncharacterized protein [Aegilops tauschii subsp. strangulata]|uniref:uncharacterized protein n=1 Tax=Aegilops tauschii subsp. strangulata TaxID=200361 RepID=UPI000989BA34